MLRGAYAVFDSGCKSYALVCGMLLSYVCVRGGRVTTDVCLEFLLLASKPN